MSETFQKHEHAPQATVAELVAQQAEVCNECSDARIDLADEVSDELNQSPEGRLQLICVEEGLSLEGVRPALLLKNRHLQVAFGRPLPMPPRIRERCVGILCEALDQPFGSPQAALSEAVVEKQAVLEDSTEMTTSIETRIADKEEHLQNVETREAEVDQDLEVANTVIDDIFQNQVTAGTLGQIREEVRQGLQANGVITDVDAAMREAEVKYIAPHEARLNAIQSVFTPQEVSQVFGGSLTQTVSLNLRGENNAQIYADVFNRIEAGITDDTRRRAIRSRIEAQLGIKSTPSIPQNAEEMRDSLNKGYGTETKTETQTVEEPPGSGNFVEKEVIVSEATIPFSEAFPFVVSHDPYVVMFPKTPESSDYHVKGRVAGLAPVETTINIPATGALPEAEIHAAVNKTFIAGNFRNAGLNGALEHLCGRSDATLGTRADVSQGAIGQTDMLQNVLQMFGGELVDIRSGFLSAGALQGMVPDLRWLTVDGNFGAMNQNDPSKVQNMMMALFGSGHGEITNNLTKARATINSGGAEAPSFQALYKQLYPQDAVNSFERLKGFVGVKGLAAMNL